MTITAPALPAPPPTDPPAQQVRDLADVLAELVSSFDRWQTADELDRSDARDDLDLALVEAALVLETVGVSS